MIKAVPLVLHKFIEDEPEMRLKGAALDNKEENNKYIIKYERRIYFRSTRKC